MGSGPSAQEVASSAAKQAGAEAQKAVQSHIKALKEQMEADRDKKKMEQNAMNDKFLAMQKELADTKNQAERERLEMQLEQNRAMARLQAEQFDDKMEASREQISMMRRSMEQQDERMMEMQRQHAEQIESYKSDHAEAMAKLTDTIKALKDENTTFVYDPQKPDKYNQLQEENFNKFCAAAAEHLGEVPKLQKHSLAVLGPSGVGKSSIINAFAGKHVTAVGLSETTDDISMVYGEGNYDFYDVPGSHDARADFFKVNNLLKLKSLHMVIIVFESRIDHCAQVAQLMVSIGLPFICVRNKCDFKKSPESSQEWQECKEKEKAKLARYTKKDDIPLLHLGYMDTAEAGQAGAKMDNFNQLESMVRRLFSTVIAN